MRKGSHPNAGLPKWPAWIPKDAIAPQVLLPGGHQADPSQFESIDAQTITLARAASAGENVILQLTSYLENFLPQGQKLDFGDGKIATLTKPANNWPTSLTVNLEADVVAGDSYRHPGLSGRTTITGGTLVGRTYDERSAGKGYGPADIEGDDEVFLVVWTNSWLEQNRDIALLRRRSIVYENRLPGWSSLDAATKAKIRQIYQAIYEPAVGMSRY